MAVISLPNISPQTRDGQQPAEWELRSISAMNRSPLNGVSPTLERPGSAWALTLRYQGIAEDKRARLQSFLSSCRGYGQRFYAPDYSRLTPRGSPSVSELLTNNFFASGTTGWEVSTANEAVLTAADGVLRVTRAANTASYRVRQSASASVVQYAPYAGRVLTLGGRGSIVTGDGQVYFDSTAQGTAPTAYGLVTASAVHLSATLQFGVADVATAKLAGDYFQIPYTSLARCFLVDNGPNSLVRSDTFDNASWTKNACTISADANTAPDGTMTADALVEDSGTSAHYVDQSFTGASAQADYFLSVAVKPNGRSFVWIQIGSSGGFQQSFFNVTTGATGAETNSGTWSDRRRGIMALGNGWYLCWVGGRKANSDTTISVQIGAASADGTQSYLGSGSQGVQLWRATAYQTGVVSRPRQTTSALTAGTSQTGSALYLKGLPASTNGLLAIGDPFEVITSVGSEFKRVTAPLNSDAAGFGYLQFEPPLRNSPADNAAVIVQRPLCRMMLDSNTIRWSEHSGGFADLEFTAVEDLAA